jgi:hypothetical protein
MSFATPAGMSEAAEQQRDARASIAARRLRTAATALIDLRETVAPGRQTAWLDSQIGAVLGMAEVLESQLG